MFLLKKVQVPFEDFSVSAVPFEEGAVPFEEGAVPFEEGAVPFEEGAVPFEEGAVPFEEGAVPFEEGAVPFEEGAVPFEEGAVPFEEGAVPFEEGAVPFEEGAVPFEEGAVPFEEGAVPFEEGAVPFEEGAVPFEEGAVPFEEGAVPFEEGAVPFEEGAVPFEEGAVPFEEGAVPFEEGAVPFEEGAVPFEEGAVPFEEGAVPFEEGAVPFEEGAVPFEEGAVPFEEGAVPFEEGAVPFEEGAVPFEEGAVPFEEGAVPFEEGAVPFEEGAVPFEEGAVPFEEGAVPFEEGVVPFEEGVVPFEGGNDCDGLDDGNVNCVATVGVLNNVRNCEVDSKVIRKFTCPNCKKEIVNLPHMQKIHGWSLASSKAVVGQFGLRKSTSKNSCHLSKICPFPGCHKVLKNTLPKHLVVVHNVVRGSEEQKSLVCKAKCHIQPSTDAPQIDSPHKDFGVSHHPQSKCTSDRYTVKANPCIADVIGPSAHVQQQEQEGYVYENRKKQPVQYNDGDSNGDSNSEENNDSDDYNPLSNEEFGEAMLETFSQFSMYMKGPDRKVKGSSLSNTMSNVRRIFDLLGVTDLPHFFDNFVDLVPDKYLGGYCIQREIKASSIRTYIT